MIHTFFYPKNLVVMGVSVAKMNPGQSILLGKGP